MFSLWHSGDSKEGETHADFQHVSKQGHAYVQVFYRFLPLPHGVLSLQGFFGIMRWSLYDWLYAGSAEFIIAQKLVVVIQIVWRQVCYITVHCLWSGSYDHWLYLASSIWRLKSSIKLIKHHLQSKKEAAPLPYYETEHCTFNTIAYPWSLEVIIPPPYGRTSRAWDFLLVMKSGCAGGRGFAPWPGQ